MRTTFKVSMAAAGALLATTAIPLGVERGNSVVPADQRNAVEQPLLAAGMVGGKRPLIAMVKDLNDKESA